jgi:hypothetical protein
MCQIEIYNKRIERIFNMKRIATILSLAVISIGFLTGCESDAQTGALLGAAIGAGVGQAAGGDTKSTAIGAAIGGGTGYVIGSQSDKNKQSRQTSRPTSASTEETIWITNSNGSQTPVAITRQGDRYVGPRGEIYSTRPTQEQLKAAYGF